MATPYSQPYGTHLMNGHTSQLWLNHTIWVHLSCFHKLCYLCLKICSQTQRGGPQVSPYPLTVRRTAEDLMPSMACPGVSERDIQTQMRTQEHAWLLDGHRQCPSNVHCIPSGSDQQGSASRLLWWNSQLWRGLGRGGEENVVLYSFGIQPAFFFF